MNLNARMVGDNMAANVLAVIPARGGSKRLPGKNIKLLDGRPLIQYSVLVAKSIDSVESIAVASDCDLTLGSVSGIFKVRLPRELTGDDATLSETLKYTLEKLGFMHGWVVLMQPTCPLRTPSLCQRWINQVLSDPDCDGLLTVDSENYKLGTQLKQTGDNYFLPYYQPMTPKQAVKPQLRENGVFYMFRAENVLASKPFTAESKMIPVVAPKTQSMANIDHQEDWDLTEWLYWTRGYAEMFKELEEMNA